MGSCSSQSRSSPKPLIRLVKIQMDNSQKMKEFEQMHKLWKKIDSVIQKMKITISQDLVLSCDEINKYLLVCKNEKTIKFSNHFFSLYDQFQQKLYEEINQNQEQWMKQKQIFDNMDSLSERFAELGYTSKGLTQSLTKY